jgi:hypothetical protein
MPAHDSPRVILAANRAADPQRYWLQLVTAADLIHGDIFFLVFDTGQPRATGATSGYVSDHVRSSRALQVHGAPLADDDDLPLDHPRGLQRAGQRPPRPRVQPRVALSQIPPRKAFGG